MSHALLALLLLSSVVAAQPLEGPFTVLDLPAGVEITNPQLAVRNDSVADVFYQRGDVVYHAAVSLHNGQVLAGPSDLEMSDEGWSRRLSDVTQTDSGWAALAYDTTRDFNRTVLFRGFNQPGTVRAIDSGRNT
jgi:hypothetical protein